MVLEGYAFEAIKLTAIGSLLAVISSLSIFPLLIYLIPKIDSTINPYIGLILLGFVLFMILREKGWDHKFWSCFIFVLSGVFGYLVLNFPSIKDPLFPMLSGLFGISMIIDSLKNNAKIPKQRASENLVVSKLKIFLALFAGTFA